MDQLLGTNTDTELDNFLNRVDDITKIIEGLTSDDTKEQERAIRKADILLHDGSGEGLFDEVKVTSDRSLVNKSPTPSTTEGGDMSQNAFMRAMEKDAAERVKDRKERKTKSDKFRAKGNQGFKNQNYAQALDNYNKAINEIKDSPCLYTNRALTYLRINVPSKALDDLDQALELNEKSLKAHLLKARAYFNLSEPQLCRQWLQETKEAFPGNLPMINRYEEDIFELKMEQNVAYNGNKEKKKGKEKSGSSDDLKSRLHDLTDPETLWIKAARGEFGQRDDEEDSD